MFQYWIYLFPTSLCGVLVFRLDPAALLRPPPRRRTHHYSSLTHHSLTPSLTHYSLTHSSQLITAPLIFRLGCRLASPPPPPLHLTHSLRQAQYRELAFCVADALHRASWRSCAGAVHRASWTSCGARGRRWGRGCLWRGRRSTQSLLLQRAWLLLGPRLPLAWQAQYTEPPGRAAARLAASGAAAAFRVAGAVHRASWRSCGARGRRWGRGCLWRGRRSTQGLLDELRRAWPPLGPRLPLAWQAQYTEPPGRAAARVAAAGAAAAFGVAGAVHRASTLTHYLSHTNLSHTIFQTPSLTHQLWHTIFHTTLSHTIFHTQLCHTPSCTNHFVTHYLSHTTLSHTIFHIFSHHLSHTTLSHTIFHTPSTPSFTHNFATHHLSHTTLSHTIFHTPLCHTPSFTPHLWHTIFVSTLSHTINTIFHTPSLTHHLSHTALSHTIFHTPSFTHTHTFVTHHLWHHIFDTHTPSFTHRHRQFFAHHLSHTTLSHTILTHLLSHTTLSRTIFHHTIFVTHHLSRRRLCHTPSFLHLFLCLSFLPRPRNKISCSILEEVDLWGYPVLLFFVWKYLSRGWDSCWKIVSRSGWFWEGLRRSSDSIPMRLYESTLFVQINTNHICADCYLEVSQNRGTPSSHPCSIGIFHHRPSNYCRTSSLLRCIVAWTVKTRKDPQTKPAGPGWGWGWWGGASSEMANFAELRSATVQPIRIAI